MAKRDRSANEPSADTDRETGDDSEFRGLPLINAIRVKADEMGMYLKDVCDRFDLSPTYWSALCVGTKPIGSLARFRLQLMADFLEVSIVEVMHLAELLSAKDFLVRRTVDSMLNSAYVKIRADPTWSMLAPSEKVWDASDQAIKIFAVSLYERLFEMELLARTRINSPAELNNQPQPAAKAVTSPVTPHVKRRAKVVAAA